MTSTSELVTPKTLASELGISEQTLSNWRATRRYELPFIKCGRLVRYRRSDVDQFLQSRTVTVRAAGKE